MFNHKKSARLRHMIHACLASSLIVPAVTFAQNDDTDIEEVVVTGSYIRNSAFATASPVDTISQEDLLQSGAPAMGQYIRDLPYTQNTDTVANVNATQTGQQDSNSARFNLRGLGTNSTLTLVDGMRSVNDGAVASLLPDIAISRLEVVLDGGSALYGSDAVAGVVNLIPIKQYDGFRSRVYYQRDERGTFEEPKISLLFGKSFDNGINWVTALDLSKKTPALRSEFPRELDYDIAESPNGNPGTFYPAVGGVVAGAAMRDPACGTYNTGNEDPTKPGAFPSGQPLGAGTCLFHYGQQHDYARANRDYTLFNNVTWDAADWLQFELQSSFNYRESHWSNSASLNQSINNRYALLVPGSHPANPWGTDVIPAAWRPFTGNGSTQPSHINSHGSDVMRYSYLTNVNKLSARYDMSETWTGYSYYSQQETRQSQEANTLILQRLQSALKGEGGVTGDQWFNPFGSSDPRSPDYVAGVTSNSQELVDWMYETQGHREALRSELEIFETVLTGELFEAPSGAVSMAAGFQMRDLRTRETPNIYSMLGQNYTTSIVDAPPEATDYSGKVNAYFVEFEAPLTDTVSVQLAARHEEFKDQGLTTTTPKVALRWEITPDLAFRASWGESFLAPVLGTERPFNANENCGEIYAGVDPVTGGTLVGSQSCSSGNPDIKPETSVIRNLGLTWEGTENLSLSLDYQEIKYEDRIRTLSTTDAVQLQFSEMLDAIGATRATYDATPGSATRTAANAWLAAQGAIAGPGVMRDPVTQQVVKTVRQSANISSVNIDLIDLKARYTYDTRNYGSLATTLTGSYYTKYEYSDLYGTVSSAVGKQNGDSGIVPPMPKFRVNLRTNWYLGNHSAAVSANYQHHVTTDGSFASYTDGFKADRLIDSQVLVNAQYAYVFNDLLNSEVTLSGGITNLFDQKAQRLPQQGGFESRLQSPWGRQFWVSVDWAPF